MWPLHSPDLIPMDYFLWGYLKQRVYQHGISYRNMTLLKETITRDFLAIDQQVIDRACSYEFWGRLNEVIRQGGGHIAHHRENGNPDSDDYLFLNDVESARLNFEGLRLDEWLVLME